MPRKSTKTVVPSPTADSPPILDTPDDTDAPLADVDVTDVTDAPTPATVAPSKSRKTILEKLDAVLDLIDKNASINVITKQLHTIRKALDGAQIKACKKTRKPNQYNMFMSEQMEKLKESDMPATERFKHCIKLWNERKDIEVVA